MATPLDERERVQLCARFDELGPDAPTLCEGWTTFDLAAHLVVRERRPLAGPGMLVGEKVAALGRVTARVMEREKAKGYDRVVERVRSGPPLGPFAVPGLRTQINLPEYTVHHEDVRRANGLETRARIDDLQDALWPLLLRLARLALRGLPDGVAVELARPTGASKVVRRGDRYVKATGDPLELLLWAHGRGDHAQVVFDGESDEDVATVRQAHIAL